MADSEADKPAKIEGARQRLERAVDALDAALEGRSRQPPAVDDKQTAELMAARAENARLRETGDAVSQGLAAAIGRIKAVLEG